MSSVKQINFEAIDVGDPEILSAAVDLTVLASYEQLQLAGEPDLVVALIDLYREDAPRRTSIMRESLVEGNWPAMKWEAHSLRGSSGHLGAIQMVLICDQIEATESGVSNMEALLSRLELELQLVLRIFAAERRRRSR